MMTNSDCEGQIFLSHPHTNNGIFFLLTTKYHILYYKNMHMRRRRPENPEYTEMRHGDAIFNISMMSQIDVQLFVFYLSRRLVRVCEIELSHMGKNSGYPDLVCKNK